MQNHSQRTVAEYTYDGLGYRTGWHDGVDGDGTVEANASGTPDGPWFRFVYDSRGKITTTYRASHHNSWTIDSNPSEQRPEGAVRRSQRGDCGGRGASYTDAVILRDREANTACESQADGTLEERMYDCQNWRADVVALMADRGERHETEHRDRRADLGGTMEESWCHPGVPAEEGTNRARTHPNAARGNDARSRQLATPPFDCGLLAVTVVAA